MGEEDIKGMFGAHGGVVSVTIVKDQLNRSKGFGFVEVRFYFLPFTPPPSLSPSLLSILCILCLFLWRRVSKRRHSRTNSLTFSLLPSFLPFSSSTHT